MAAANQAPLNSGFDFHAKASEVMEGIDLSGKSAVVTGGYSGLGLEVVRALTAAGADVVVPARDPKRAGEALASAGLAAGVVAMDLANLASVAEAAAEIGDAHDKVDLLINNAGIMACPESRTSAGWEMQFAVNHIGHHVLARELMPYLLNANGARVVAVSSAAHKRTPVLFDDIHFKSTPYDKWLAYAQSKTANALFALELNRRRSADGIKAFSVHPGTILTPIMRHLPKGELANMGWVDEKGEPTDLAKQFIKAPDEGAATILWAATSSLLDDRGGEYCENCDIAAMVTDSTPRWAGVVDWAVDESAAARLWEMTDEMVLSASA